MAQQDLIIGAQDAGTGDSYFEAFTKAQANFTDLYALSTKANNTVVINQESDFPDPVSGVITLAAKTNYLLGADISTGNRFVVGDGGSLTSFGPYSASLTYTGIGVMFTGEDATFSILNTQIGSASASQYFSFVDITPGVHFFSMRNSGFLAANKLGTFTALGAVITHFVDGALLTDGITMAGACGAISLSETSIASNASGTCIDFGSSTYSILCELKDVAFIGTGAGAKGIDGLVSDGNIPSGLQGQVAGCEFVGTLATTGQLTNISVSDIRWNFVNNANLSNSTKTGDTYLIGGQTVTINTLGVFESINGAGWLSDITERFSASSSGILTYIGETDEKFLVVGVAAVEKSGGGADEIEMEIALNGTEVAKTGSITQNTSPGSITCVGSFTLSQNDTIELKVANNSGTTNIIVSHANLNIVNGF